MSGGSITLVFNSEEAANVQVPLIDLSSNNITSTLNSVSFTGFTYDSATGFSFDLATDVSN